MSRHRPSPVAELLDYYTKAGPDYEVWSRQFNMHFGFFRWGMNPFDLEGMLEQMNREVVENLELEPDAPSHVLDMGCGVGATARHVSRHHPSVRVSGLTIVPWQIREAVRWARPSYRVGSMRFVRGDYTSTPFRSGSFDGVYALESSCYAPGLSKEPLLREMHRVLKPGRRFVVADAFLKTTRPMNGVTRACYRALCESWALETWGEIHRFTEVVERLGFRDVRVVNISPNVTPSVMHVPYITLKFLVKEWLSRRGTMDDRRFGHAIAGFLLLFFALDRTRSGYFLVTGRKAF